MFMAQTREKAVLGVVIFKHEKGPGFDFTRHHHNYLKIDFLGGFISLLFSGVDLGCKF